MSSEPEPGGADGSAVARPASVGRRFLAAAYDAPVIFCAMLVATALLLALHGGERLDSTPLSLALYRSALVAIWAAYYVFCWHRWGWTLGMRIWRHRVVRLDGTSLRWSDACLRLAASPLAWLPLALGLLAAAFNPNRRAWHDRLSRTQVIATD